MALDAETRKQLLQAQSTIVAQLDDIRSRLIPGNCHGGAGPPDYEGIIAELLDELREIDQLLSNTGEDHT